MIIALATPKRKSAAELLLLAGAETAAGVGPAQYFVSWFLGQKLDDLFEALEAFEASPSFEGVEASKASKASFP